MEGRIADGQLVRDLSEVVDIVPLQPEALNSEFVRGRRLGVKLQPGFRSPPQRAAPQEREIRTPATTDKSLTDDHRFNQSKW